ncbi:MAG: TlyA family RNA methyltransferase [Acidimicrobiia bacterium]|nr:TlyA family RNA methyltransferase [Acidimicrobiia bacterium]
MARRRLDAELVHRKIVSSRAAAQRAIAEGLVEVNGFTATKSASQVEPTASIRLAAPVARFVSRGGLKLEGALNVFGIEVSGKRALDAGASTGGFTDCLLQRGASMVAAVDVGYGQLDWKLRQDDRVAVHERLNVRHMDIDAMEGPFDLVVGDLSFISLRTVAERIAAAGTLDADWVLLVKPQFEAGKDLVGKGGIVRDVAVRELTIKSVIEHFEKLGLNAHGITDSPIEGAKGNREFLVWLRRDEAESPLSLESLEGLQDA